RIAKRVLLAFVPAHGSGILHCDLKPANVLFDNDFEPRLCDFGQSRLSDEQNPALGTLYYMAPEQADLRAVPDARWDVYALGAVMYRVLTGAPPYHSDAAAAAVRQGGSLEDRLARYREWLRRSPRPAAHRKVPGVDRGLAEVIDRCLAVDPRKRYANVQAVLTALNERALRRARRPLLVLGVAGPLVLLSVMIG